MAGHCLKCSVIGGKWVISYCTHRPPPLIVAPRTVVSCQLSAGASPLRFPMLLLAPLYVKALNQMCHTQVHAHEFMNSTMADLAISMKAKCQVCSGLLSRDSWIICSCADAFDHLPKACIERVIEAVQLFDTVKVTCYM